MKLTKGMQNAMIQGFFANLIFILIFSIALFVYIYPGIRKFEVLKDELLITSTALQDIQKNGLNHQDFLMTVPQINLGTDVYYRDLLLNIDRVFYTQYFQNSTESDYATFLRELEQKTIAQKNTPEYIEKTQIVDTILPFYTANRNEGSQGVNDFYFVSYVENILYSFNLEATWDIGVGNVKKFEDANIILSTPLSEEEESSQEPLTKNSLQEDIYIIPLSFDITGQKSDILDFLHFFENVGWITQEGENLQIHTDKVITKKLDGNTSWVSSNIYLNQIATIEKISFSEYPDSSTFSTKTSYTSLTDIIRQEQWREEYSLNIVLHFYVSGLPLYKVEQSTEELSKDIVSFQQQITKDITLLSTWANKGAVENQKKLSFLSSFQSTLLALKWEVEILKNIEDIEWNDMYEKIVSFQKRFEKMQEIYDSRMTTSLEK